MERRPRPSDSWKTAQQYEQDESYTCAFWRTIPFDKLEQLATRLRSVKCHANREKYAQGHEAVAIELVFEDQEIWIARLRAPVDICGIVPSAEVLARETECEVATLKLVRERTRIPVATVFAYSGSRDNDIGVPYILMSALAGSKPEQVGLGGWYSHVKPADMPRYHSYLDSLADVYLQLSRIQFDKIGSVYFDPCDSSKYVIGPLADTGLGPFETAWEYYSACAENLERRVLTLSEDTPDEREGRALVLWLYRLGVGLLANSPNDRGPFPLAHNDLEKHNTLVDKDGNITGIVDWAQASACPAEQFAAQSFDHTADPTRPDSPDTLPASRAFSVALEHRERHRQLLNDNTTNSEEHARNESYIDSRAAPPVANPNLTQLHASPLAYLVGRLFALLDGPDHCAENPFAEIVARCVLGVQDAAPLKKSVLFREWYAETLRRVDRTNR